MEKIIRFTFFVSCLALFNSCDPGEETVSALPPGNVERTTIEQGATYNEQIWFSFLSEGVTATTQKFDWDLEFSSSQNQGAVFLNGSKFMQAGATQLTSVTDSVDVATVTLDIDHQSGDFDSLQIGLPSASVGTVFLLDLGRDINNKNYGYVLFQITEVKNNVIDIAYRFYGNSAVKSASISLSEKEKVHYSFIHHEVVQGLPISENWDICFTQYSYRFYEPPLNYLVNGVFINTNRFSVAEDATRSFESIELSTTDSLAFSKDRDVIGYDWKAYNLDQGVYVVYPEKNYVLRSKEGVFIKLHFIDFYNKSGERGYPLMEWQRL